MSILSEIRRTNDFVVRSSRDVFINDIKISEYAKIISSGSEPIGKEVVQWDCSGWHYCADADSGGPLTCQYIFVLDCLNFCFWPSRTGIEYEQLAVGLKIALEKDPNAFNASSLKEMTSDVLQSWFPGQDLPLLEERVDRLRELGAGLLEEFDGVAFNVVKRACGSVASLVRLLLSHFPGFRDTVVYRGRLVHFYKRAQILVGDIWAAYGRKTDTSDVCSFRDLDQLTMFADYRVPQILRAIGILDYSFSLAEHIDLLKEIPFGNEWETEIRAATVVAVDRLRDELERQPSPRGLKMMTIELDWLLWQRGEAERETLLPHHRTLTIYY